MPADRLIHPRLGHSQKVNLLTDLEFRVWTQYLLSADDFGVMRFSAVNVQADNDALHNRPSRTIQRCLERLVDVRLLADFEHQKRKYLYQRDWQQWQHVKFPRTTNNPAPPQECLATCDDATHALFLDHHPLLTSAESVTNAHTFEGSESVTNPSTDAPQIAANGLRLTANGLRERFAEFWQHYPRKVGKDAAWKAWLKRKPSQELLQQMLAVLAWQVKQDDWTKDNGQFIPHPATWINQGRWEDEPTAVAPVSQTQQPGSKRVAVLMEGGQAFLNRRRG